MNYDNDPESRDPQAARIVELTRDLATECAARVAAEAVLEQVRVELAETKAALATQGKMYLLAAQRADQYESMRDLAEERANRADVLLGQVRAEVDLLPVGLLRESLRGLRALLTPRATTPPAAARGGTGTTVNRRHPMHYESAGPGGCLCPDCRRALPTDTTARDGASGGGEA